MDKSWMSVDRRSLQYDEGVKHFLEFGAFHSSNQDYIRCPCQKCRNVKVNTIREIRNHLYEHGIDQSYSTWYWHGEAVPNLGSDSTPKQKKTYNEDKGMDCTIEMVEAAHDLFVNNPAQFEQLLEDAEKPVYPGAELTKLSALLRLYNIKSKHRMSDVCLTDMLAYLKVLLPNNNEMPSSVYEAKKTLGSLGMKYEKIHACPGDCILYRKEHTNAIACPTCGLSRWKVNKNSNIVHVGVPAKVMWYFPLIPRFTKMFQNKEVAKNLIWHAEERVDDGKLRHPADSPSWKLVDHMFPEFGDEPRNLRLAISADGINPHSSCTSRYSCWPVIMTVYNLPPRLCMKRKFFMLTMLISGPKQPGNDIDVYLAPLVDDLKTLWEVGVDTHDAYKEEMFLLKAVLLWTINDFPAYGNLCGCTVHGYKACPICGDNTYSTWLSAGKKVSYTGHRRFLPLNHPFRKQVVFNGKAEYGIAPIPLCGEEILQKVDGIKAKWGKKISTKNMVVKGANLKKKGITRKRKMCGKNSEKQGEHDVNPKKKKANQDGKAADLHISWKKRSIFFDLPYWKSLHVRHCLDVMHIEKNVCENIYGTLLNIPKKSKDGPASRRDLIALGIRTDLAPKQGKKKVFLPPGPYTLSKDEKISVCKALLEVKVPKAYVSNFKNLVSMEDLKLVGLKSHDCHILIQQLLPVAIRGVLPKHVRYAIIRFCRFFVALCSKVIDVEKLDGIQRDLVVTLCLLEKIFPPSFFDVMVHLTVHLTREVRLCGPVYMRWMYPFERYMKILKGYVRNRKCPEACMIESYLAEESVEICTDYMPGVQPIGIPLEPRSHFKDVGNSLSVGCSSKVDRKLWQQSHLYVLDNTPEVQPYINEHKLYLKRKHPKHSKNEKWLQDEHNRTFIAWLKKTVEDELDLFDKEVSETLRWMAHGPRQEVVQYSGYTINGCDYHTKTHDDLHVQQNSGVSLVANTMQVSSSKDKNPVFANMTFYGVIQEIWELNYNTFTRVVYKCDWVESSKGVKVDECGDILVDFSRLGHKSDTFVLAGQVHKVFYMKDPQDSRWSVVLDTSEMAWLEEEMGDIAMDNQCFSNTLPPVESFDVLIDHESVYVRSDCEGTWVEEPA